MQRHIEEIIFSRWLKVFPIGNFFISWVLEGTKRLALNGKLQPVSEKIASRGEKFQPVLRKFTTHEQKVDNP